MFKLAAQRALSATATRSLTSAPRVASLGLLRNPYSTAASSPHSSNMSMTVTEAITHDHRELNEYYNNIKKAPDSDTATRWQNQFVWELARHSIGEELVVYPAFEKYLGEEGKKMADRDRADHNEVKLALKKFQNLYPTDADFHPTLDALMKTLREHIHDEETHDLPALEKAVSGDGTASIARSFERTKMFTPTRSHPSAPDKPPFETVAGLMAAPLDRLADLFRKFPDEDTPRPGR